VAQLISLVVPFYNEVETIDQFVSTILAIVESIPDVKWEIVCVDDGSVDLTLAKLISYSSRDSRFKLVELSRNFGKEAALTAGMDFAAGAAVIPIDADLQDPPELIGEMIEAWRSGAEVVLARRIDRSTDSLLKRKTAAWFYQLHNRLSKISLPENVGDFRLMDRIVVDALKRLPERQRFMKGIFAWIGFKTVTIDYVRAERSAGKTKFSGLALWNLAMEGFTSFSTVPLRIWTYIGALSSVLCFLYAAYIVVSTLFFGISVRGYASIFVAIMFFGSVQMISIGLLGEYIGRIYMETKRRPNYIVRKLHQI